jgi:serine/threonine-protein kinase
MATCPECRVTFADDVKTCPQHGVALVADARGAEEAPIPEGTMVGEYRIAHKLGAGTFGDVYAGEQPVIGKRVAVKVLNRRFASDPVMVSRFVAEARAVNKIRQRNIIDIFSFGVVPGLDRHYFVMELLDGMTLGALLDRTGRLPVALVLPVVRGIADALDAVHEAGITHRDLKPDNVFLARERDGSYFPKLLDFGIAKLLDEDVAHKTGSGMVLGTPRYMSPEQARGKKADHRSDIYALGVMIHEMLTGTPLFEGDSAVDLLLKQAVDEPSRPSEVCPDLPPELDGPVLDMLRKRPEQRPQTAGKAVAALAARAQALGLDKTEVTLAALAEGAPTKQSVPKATGTTVTIERKPAKGAVRSDPITRDRDADPMSKTERAPASAGATLPSPRVATSATPAAGEILAPGGPTTESVSTVETSSGIRRLNRARRTRIAAGAVIAAALAGALWTAGHKGTAPAGAPVVVASSAIATPIPMEDPQQVPQTPPIPPAPSTNKELEPTVRPATTPLPSPATEPTSSADAGSPAKGSVAPAPSAHHVKPPSTARNLDRILEDR